MPASKRFSAGAFALAAVLTRPAFADDAPSPGPSSAPPLKVVASATLVDVAREVAATYAVRFPGSSATVTPMSSGEALAAVANGDADVALADFAPANAALVDHRPLAIGFAIVANPLCGVTSLSAGAARDVFAGKLTNWKQAGGDDRPVHVVSRGATSGVQLLIGRALLGGAPAGAGYVTAGPTTLAVAAVIADRGGVTVTTFGGARSAGVVTLALDGVPADESHVASGAYRLWTFAHAVTLGAAGTAASRYLGILETDRGALSHYGFISARDLAAGAAPA